MIREALLAGCGGFVGTALRFAVSGFFASRFSSTTLPLGTLCVNLVGCFLIGFLFHYLSVHLEAPPLYRVILISGFLGGFTTYSAFGLEGLTLLRSGSSLLFAIYIGIHLVGGLALVYLGQRTSVFIAG